MDHGGSMQIMMVICTGVDVNDALCILKSVFDHHSFGGKCLYASGQKSLILIIDDILSQTIAGHIFSLSSSKFDFAYYANRKLFADAILCQFHPGTIRRPTRFF